MNITEGAIMQTEAHNREAYLKLREIVRDIPLDRLKEICDEERARSARERSDGIAEKTNGALASILKFFEENSKEKVFYVKVDGGDGDLALSSLVVRALRIIKKELTVRTVEEEVPGKPTFFSATKETYENKSCAPMREWTSADVSAYLATYNS